MKNNKSVKKVVLITGCSKGLGEELYKSCLEKGIKVFATARSTPNDSKNSEDLIWHTLDVSNYDECEIAIKKCIKEFGRIDCLINNAAGPSKGVSIAENSREDIDVEIDTILKGSAYLTQLFVSNLKNQGNGKIFFISSTSGLSGVRTIACTQLSKRL